MKVLAFLLAAGLASARLQLPRQAAANGLNVGSSAANISVGAAVGCNLANINLGSLDGVDIGGVNLGRVNLRNQDIVAEAILAMLGNFGMANALTLNQILGLGLSNDVQLFLQLAQLVQMERRGLMDLARIQSLVNNGLILRGFNLGNFKREIAEVRKTIKRTRRRRGLKAKRQCQTPPGRIITIATAPSEDPGITTTATAAAAVSSASSSAAGDVTATPAADVAGGV